MQLARNSTWRLLLEVTFSVLRFPSNQFSKTNSQRRNEMFSTLSTRRGFAGRLAALIPGLSLSGTALPGSAEPQAAAGVQKLDYEGKTRRHGFYHSFDYPQRCDLYRRSGCALALPWREIPNGH